MSIEKEVGRLLSQGRSAEWIHEYFDANGLTLNDDLTPNQEQHELIDSLIKKSHEPR